MKKLLLYALLLPIFIQPKQKTLRFLYDLAQDYGDFFQQDEHDNGFWKKFKEALQKKGYTAQAAQYSLQSLQDSYDADCVIFFNLPMSLTHGKLRPLHNAKTAVFLFEPPATSPHQYQHRRWEIVDKVFTWHDGLVDNKKVHKFHWMQYNLDPDNPFMCDQRPFAQKKLCTMISSNRHSNHPQALFNKRLEIIDFFDSLNTHEFDLYGRSCAGNRRKNYRGAVDNKYQCMKDYRFYICFENMDGPAGYITEKIFDCFFGGCIPIYIGAPNIEKYVPQDCFINMRNFNSYQELYNFIKNMPATKHEQYLTNIKNFLAGPQARPFSQEAMIETYLSCLKE